LLWTLYRTNYGIEKNGVMLYAKDERITSIINTTVLAREWFHKDLVKEDLQEDSLHASRSKTVLQLDRWV
jgi:hypothetical protein